jgi:DNA invertase Pin-like site-specific DNA recombinase
LLTSVALLRTFETLVNGFVPNITTKHLFLNASLMLNTLGRVAPFKRETMLERRREGIAKAKPVGGK